MTYNNGPQGPQWGPHGSQGPQQPQQGYYQQPPQEPKKKSKLKWVLIIVGILLVVGMCSVATSGDDDSSSSGTSSTPGTSQEASQPEQPDAGIGQPVQDGKFEFVVSGVESGVPFIGPEGFGEQAQGQFVIVRTTVTNIGDEAQSFSASNMTLFDDQGRKFDADSWASSLVDDTNASGIYDNINPGNSAQAAIVFDIPVDAVPATVKLHDSMFSGGVEVSLL